MHPRRPMHRTRPRPNDGDDERMVCFGVLGYMMDEKDRELPQSSSSSPSSSPTSLE